VITDVAELAERLDVSEEEIVVAARATPGQRSSLAYAPRLLLEPEALSRLVRAALALAARVTRPEA
jgi:hypothetical protein